ncbi:MAG TPA: hypothetical protein VFS00_22560, partial [Polyangiaceae bacterium]|nr:hypothetical protein [Polyangiaceae bacterium]
AFALHAAWVRPSERVDAAASRLRAALRSLEVGALPPSALKPGSLEGSDVPRGCALSWTVAMRGLYDGAAARGLYERYRQAFWSGAGPLGGFREWPPGVERAADVDSGPIVLGVGAAATAIGIGAARLVGSHDDARALLATADAASGARARGGAGGRPLERAILLWAQTTRPWLAAPRP